MSLRSGDTTIADLVQHRIALDAILNEGVITLASEAIEAADRAGNVVLELVFIDQGTAGFTEHVPTPAGDDQDAAAAAAMGRFDHELVASADHRRQLPDGVLRRDDAIQLRHRHAGSDGQLLGAQLVVHERVEPSRVPLANVVGVALVDPQHALLPQSAAQLKHHPLPRARKRSSSRSR